MNTSEDPPAPGAAPSPPAPEGGTRDGAGGARRRLHPQDELIARKPLLREDFGILPVNRAACLGVDHLCHAGPPIHCSAMMQAAWLSMSPLLTRRVIRPDALASRSRDSAAREVSCSSVVTTCSP